MKVLLVNPPARRFVRYQWPSFPLGLAYVASAVADAGHEVEIYDAEWGPDFAERMKPVEHPLTYMALNWQRYFNALTSTDHEIWQEVEQVIRERQPDVLGVTCRVLDLASARVIAAIAKRIDPRMKVVFGGPATSTCADQIVGDPNVDVAVRGEGEITTVEMLRAMESSKADLKTVSGVSFSGPFGPMHTPDRGLIADISSLPLPAREKLTRTDLLPRRKVDHMMGELITSRGCPFKCTFCAVRSVWGSPKVRLRDPEDVVDEVIHQRDRYGARFFTFWDDLFTTKRRRTMEICRLLLERQAAVKWLCLVQAKTVDEEQLAIMKEAGCVQVQMGVESGTDRILDKMQKGLTLEQIRRTAELIHRVGLSFHAFFIIGVPGETREEMETTMRFMQELEPDYAELSVFAPYPGSPLADEMIRAGRLRQEDWLTADFLNADRCHTGTMRAPEFREFALRCLWECDEYNNRRAAGAREPQPEPSVACTNP